MMMIILSLIFYIKYGHQVSLFVLHPMLRVAPSLHRVVPQSIPEGIWRQIEFLGQSNTRIFSFQKTLDDWNNEHRINHTPKL